MAILPCSKWVQWVYVFLRIIYLHPLELIRMEYDLLRSKWLTKWYTWQLSSLWTGTWTNTRKQNRNISTDTNTHMETKSKYYFDFISMCVFVCLSAVNSSIFGKSSHFPFPYFVLLVLRYFPFHVAWYGSCLIILLATPLCPGALLWFRCLMIFLISLPLTNSIPVLRLAFW